MPVENRRDAASVNREFGIELNFECNLESLRTRNQVIAAMSSILEYGLEKGVEIQAKITLKIQLSNRKGPYRDRAVFSYSYSCAC